MSKLNIRPFEGINRRLPEHRITGDKKQYFSELINYINLDGRWQTIFGAERLDSTDHGGFCSWIKRMYWAEGNDKQKALFAILNRQFYKADEDSARMNLCQINQSDEIKIEDVYPSSARLKVSGNVCEYLVDGRFFYKFDGNEAGQWERLNVLIDTDGNEIEPIDIVEYQDRAFVLVKQRNIILFSKNLNPENYSDSTDAGIIELPPGNGGFPQKLFVHRGFLFCMHEDYFTPVSGSSVSTYGVPPGSIIYGWGTRAPRSVVNLKDSFGFLNSTDNEYYLSSGTLDSTMKVPLSYPIKLGELMNPVKSDQTVAFLDNENNLLRISYVKSGEVLLDAEEVFSLSEEKWCSQTRGRKISCYTQYNGKEEDQRIVTGRSDIGCVMINGRGYNFDGNAVRYRFVTGSVGSDDETKDLQFEYFYLDAKAESKHTMPLSYYLDTRLTTRGLEDVNMQGEIINLGLIEIAEQTSFLQRILPLVDKSKGRMIRFESDETQLNVHREMYGIYAHYNQAEKKSSKTIVGA